MNVPPNYAIEIDEPIDDVEKYINDLPKEP